MNDVKNFVGQGLIQERTAGVSGTIVNQGGFDLDSTGNAHTIRAIPDDNSTYVTSGSEPVPLYDWQRTFDFHPSTLSRVAGSGISQWWHRRTDGPVMIG